ncbi:MAG: hypothetical protein M3434_01345, partial [Gemmatimonadota bacterium]|nr:hypothetical protein [Gemmatimonadota bacterium]
GYYQGGCMRKTILLLASAALAVLFFSAITGYIHLAAQTTPVKPSFVFILTDDMRKDDLKYMPKTRALLGFELPALHLDELTPGKYTRITMDANTPTNRVGRKASTFSCVEI